jgi:hypothetical protein
MCAELVRIPHAFIVGMLLPLSRWWLPVCAPPMRHASVVSARERTVCGVSLWYCTMAFLRRCIMIKLLCLVRRALRESFYDGCVWSVHARSCCVCLVFLECARGVAMCRRPPTFVCSTRACAPSRKWCFAVAAADARQCTHEWLSIVMTVTAWRADTAFGDAGAAAIAAGLEKNVGLASLNVEGTLQLAVAPTCIAVGVCLAVPVFVSHARIRVACAFEFPVYLCLL